ncbi:family 1 glycosylhydrolase [Hymenobacter sp. 15J16-1T3B]|uniref:family 1 glycosylhydrolase n=1 Tax=Hymenobacter sp. 15J16-1T3B TaxID=2886941 RepID=UPI001D10CF0C|nr:family 1 glycosylhydrolase [Hymenobacter sp. 15J16-1T3B]MCC3157690.1 family 1 glycosylhydrolase [Hymenobacter sp. 15J16-1T3B]
MAKLELWGGVECSIRRVQNDFSDQTRLSGHRERLTDLEEIAELGLRRLRYPVLWENVAPDSLDAPDWSWTDERMNRLRELGIAPIAGLVHHGSGPRYTAMDQPSFVTGLARYARMVAERYPWVMQYTPVNEPLTTARFSGLYGLWYPHRHDDDAFVRMLLHQVQATKAAMLAIREVNPRAQLVQTEDLGKIHSTPHLAYQAEFENHRRWLSFDLLCGRVTPEHALYPYLLEHGARAEELAELVSAPLPPDVLGINYYVTSERFLDERLEHYPAHSVGRNHQEHYADVEAVRVAPLELAGLENLLLEAWERYRLPLAVTEVQLACTREEQMRWLQQAWQQAQAARRAGADVRAVTVWALFGAYNWNTLLTRDDGHYETGVFDVRGGQPRRTALFRMAQHLAQGRAYDHPVLHGAGWWQRPDRFAYRHTQPTQP